MSAENVIANLKACIGTDFEPKASEIMRSLDATSDAAILVPQLIRFMERHPDDHLGSPGPLVHYIETFPADTYTDALFQSVKRNPTMYPVWMATRLLNGTRDRALFDRLTALLTSLALREDIDADMREDVTYVLERNRNR